MRLDRLKKAQFFLIIFYFLIIFSAGAGGAEPGRLYPVTLLEMQKVLSLWLTESGYRVFQSAGPDGAVQLNGVRENERWRIVLQAHSPLYSSVEAECLLDGRPSPKRIQELSAFVDDYVAKNTGVAEKKKTDIPPALLRNNSIVCISASSANTPISFSGFVVDTRGIILSTAHDLDAVKDVTVMTSDGRRLKGRLIKKDMRRDLAMISVESRFSSSLNLVQGRNILKKGEPVFALTCQDGKRKILSGEIAGPVKAQENVLLWQVEMETPKGSSGSPVFDRDGKIVAVVKGRYRGNQTIGFIIPLEAVVKFLTEE